MVLKDRFVEESKQDTDTNLECVVLALEENPEGIFYKDEGGKSNFLTASCFVHFESQLNNTNVPINDIAMDDEESEGLADNSSDEEEGELNNGLREIKINIDNDEKMNLKTEKDTNKNKNTYIGKNRVTRKSMKRLQGSRSTTALSVPIGNLVLTPRLIYECGTEIEDESEIFNVLSFEPKTITATNESFVVRFRIEKVSRRKDGKRFKVRFDVNAQKTRLLPYINGENIRSVETSSVAVYSKRKPSHLNTVNNNIELNGIEKENKEKIKGKGKKNTHSVSRRSISERNKEKDDTQSEDSYSNLSKNGNIPNGSCIATIECNGVGNETVVLPVDVLMKMHENMAALEKRVIALTERVCFLENQKLLASPGLRPGSQLYLSHSQDMRIPPSSMNSQLNRGHRVHSLMFENEYPQSGAAASSGPEAGTSSNNSNSSGILQGQQYHNHHFGFGNLDSSIKRNNSSKELLDFLASSSILN